MLITSFHRRHVHHRFIFHHHFTFHHFITSFGSGLIGVVVVTDDSFNKILLLAECEGLEHQVHNFAVASTFNFVLDTKQTENTSSELEFTVFIKVREQFADHLEELEVFLFLFAVIAFFDMLFEFGLVLNFIE